VASLLHYRGDFAFGELMHLAVWAVPAKCAINQVWQLNLEFLFKQSGAGNI
jgi:hypothetical protein